MEAFVGGFLAILGVIAVLVGFVLFIQYMSKITGKRIVRGGFTRQTMATPNDFDDTIDAMKKASENLGDYIKQLNLTHIEKLVFKFEKVLKKPVGLDFTSYFVNKTMFENLINQIVSEGKISKSDLLKSMEYYSIINQGIVSKMTFEKLRKYKNAFRQDLNTFNQSDYDLIQSFMLPVLKNDQEKLIDFLDLLGRPNFKDFAIVINDVEKMYLNGRISKEDIKNLKLVILKRKGMIDTFI
jgi:hypothetical protein